ncbi:MAG: hypothetical protein JWO19_1243 [Bryobacterales bacterium]|jgi:hypothetical protein|nr:hypothetical protein [Bryobacterales bacterium]
MKTDTCLACSNRFSHLRPVFHGMSHAPTVIVMYRISRVFETATVAIVKVAGQVTDLDLVGWSDFLMGLDSETTRWIVLDFCDVSRVERNAAELLVQILPKNVLLINCPTVIKNMADSGGLYLQVLEPTTTGQTRHQCFLSLDLQRQGEA